MVIITSDKATTAMRAGIQILLLVGLEAVVLSLAAILFASFWGGLAWLKRDKLLARSHDDHAADHPVAATFHQDKLEEALDPWTRRFEPDVDGMGVTSQVGPKLLLVAAGSPRYDAAATMFAAFAGRIEASALEAAIDEAVQCGHCVASTNLRKLASLLALPRRPQDATLEGASALAALGDGSRELPGVPWQTAGAVIEPQARLCEDDSESVPRHSPGPGRHLRQGIHLGQAFIWARPPLSQQNPDADAELGRAHGAY